MPCWELIKPILTYEPSVLHRCNGEREGGVTDIDRTELGCIDYNKVSFVKLVLGLPITSQKRKYYLTKQATIHEGSNTKFIFIQHLYVK